MPFIKLIVHKFVGCFLHFIGQVEKIDKLVPFQIKICPRYGDKKAKVFGFVFLFQRFIIAAVLITLAFDDAF